MELGEVLTDFHPAREVADYEVLLSFAGDDEGIAFRDWLYEQGFEVFKSWYEEQ